MTKMLSSTPTRKVGAGAIAGALSVLLVWLLNMFLPDGKHITPEIASSLTTVLTFVVGYFVPPAASDQVVQS